MLNDQEWVELLEYLINRLADLQYLDLVSEIRIAISTRIVEDARIKPEFGALLAIYKDVGNTQTRALSPREAFEKAIEVIRMWLLLIPLTGERVTQMLQRPASQVVWQSEEQSYLYLSQGDTVSASSLIFSDRESEQIKSILHHISNLLNKA